MCNVEGPPLRAQVPAMMPGGDPLPIYLDHNATTPVAPEAWEAMMACQHVWGNPSSTHPYGLQAKYVVEGARAEVAKALCVSDTVDPASCITFTSCGTEANNLAIFGTINRQRDVYRRNVIVTSNVEHPATAEVLAHLPPDGGFEIVTACVRADTGAIDVADFEALYEPLVGRVALVSIMHANNETGSLQPMTDIIRIIRRLEGGRASLLSGRALVHVDAAQTLGKIPLSVEAMDVDLLSVVGHKFYAPKGVGALYHRPDVVLTQHTFGAGHEKGLRPGTENIILIAGMARALTIATAAVDASAGHMRRCRDELHAELKRRLEEKGCELVINGALDTALPNTLNCAIRQSRSGLFISANRLLTECGAKVAASAGSACHSTSGDEPIVVSKPLQAVGVDLDRAMGTLRLSTGKLNTVEEMQRAAKIIATNAIQQFSDW